MVEACAQVAAVCALTHPDHQGKFGVFAAIDDTRFTPHRAARRRARHHGRDGAPAHARSAAAAPTITVGGEPAVRGDAHVRPARGAAGVIGALRSTRRHRLDRRGRARADRHERRARARASTPRDAWIRARTGIRERRIAAPDEFASDLGLAAAQQALDRSGLAPAEIDLVVCATCSPDSYFPSDRARTIADRARRALGGGRTTSRRPAPAGSTRSCTPSAQIQAGLAEHVLVVGAETLSKVLDWDDRATCILFGDGAGACVISAGAAARDGVRRRARRRRLARQRPDRRRAARHHGDRDGRRRGVPVRDAR